MPRLPSRFTLLLLVVAFIVPRLLAETAADSFAAGVAARQAGRNAEAIAAFTQVLAAEPQRAEACWQLGLARAAQGDLDGALADCDRAVQLAPDRAAAWNARGSVRLQRKEYPQAIADCTRATELDPNLADAFFNLGSAHSAQGDRLQAVADFARAAALQPADPSAQQAKQVAESQKTGVAIALLGNVVDILQEEVKKNPGRFGRDFGKVLGGVGSFMKAAQAGAKPAQPAATKPATPPPAPAPIASAPPPPAPPSPTPVVDAPASTPPSAPTPVVPAAPAVPSQADEEQAIRQTLSQLCAALTARNAAQAAQFFSPEARDSYQKQLEEAKDQLPGLVGPLQGARIGAVSPQFLSETRGAIRTAQITIQQDGQETRIELIKLQGQWRLKTL
ncbi:MAG: tetratricopeptide repeat protein [Opitutae bacterium]|nr:tetratricopeptide repeat protein [Opitutae bacterium]